MSEPFEQGMEVGRALSIIIPALIGYFIGMKAFKKYLKEKKNKKDGDSSL